MGSFVQRLIRFDIELKDGTYTDQGKNNVVTIQNVRANVVIDFAGGSTVTNAQAMIWGLDKKLMDKLTVFPPIANSLSGNKITISVGDITTRNASVIAKTGVIYNGDIFRAYADYSGAPDVPFIIETTINMAGAINPAKPISKEGGVTVGVLVDQVADYLGAFVEDHGVEEKGVYIANPYYSGTPMQMLQKIRQDANVDIYYMPPTIHLCLKGQPITTASPFLITANTGLIGYPAVDINGMILIDVLYNPSLFHGARVDLQTNYPNCNGTFYIVSMSIVLESQTPSGQWTASLRLANFALMTPQAV